MLAGVQVITLIRLITWRVAWVAFALLGLRVVLVRVLIARLVGLGSVVRWAFAVVYACLGVGNGTGCGLGTFLGLRRLLLFKSPQIGFQLARMFGHATQLAISEEH